MIESLNSRVADRRHDLLVALGLGFLALSVYLLTFSGLFRSIDELTMFSQAESLVQGLGAETRQLIFAEIHHNFRAHFEPFQALLIAPLYLLAFFLPGVGNLHTALLLNLFLSAAAVAFVWLSVRELGFSRRTGLQAAFGFAFATLVWPYSRTLYREPTATLSLVCALYFFIRYSNKRSLRDAFLCLLPLLLSVASRSETMISLILFSGTMLLVNRSRLLQILPLILSFLLGAGIVLVFNFGYRFPGRVAIADPGSTLVVLGGQLDPARIVSRLWGLTLAPGKGLFVYAPLLALFPLGIKPLWGRYRILVGLLLAVALFYLLLFSMYFDWRGGVAWGPRFLVPLSVPLIILVAPIFSRVGWLLYLGLVAMAMSTAIQFVASTANWAVYYEYIKQQFSALTPLFLDPAAYGWSPVIGQFQIWRPENMDLIWLRAPQAGASPILDIQVLAILLLLFLVAAASLYLILAKRTALRPSLLISLEGLVFLGGIFLFLRQAYAVDAGYWDAATPAVRRVAEEVNASPASKPLVVSVSSNFGYNTLMNYLKGDFQHFWLSPLQDDMAFLSSPASQADRIFLVTDGLIPGSENSYAERWLNAQAFRYDAQWFGPYLLFQYAPPRSLIVRQSGAWEWPGIRLVEFALPERELRRGDLLPLEFTFTASSSLNADYSLFVHLIRSDGFVIDGEDAPPQYSARPTSSWQMGELVVDRRALVIPLTLPPGGYSIEIGFTLNGERVQPFEGEGLTERDTFIIAHITVADQ